MPTVAADALAFYMADIFRATGAPPDEARMVGEHLVGANLRGHDSHGVIRGPWYVGFVQDGRLKPGARPRVVRESASTAYLDGAWNFGQIVATEAMRIAIAKARETGVGVVSAFNSGHIGRVGAYGEQAVAAGMIGIGTVNSPGSGLTAAHGGARRRLGTSPIMIAMPTERADEPFVLDMATSVVAEGKLRVAVNKGVPVPEHWIIDGDGRPTTDPRDFYGTGANATQGALLPVGGATGGYKGFGLNMAVEALSGMLSGAGTGAEGPRGTNGVFMMALDPASFAGLGPFAAMLEGLIGWVQQPPYAPGFEEVLVAGEPERRTMADRLAHGVPLDDETWRQITECAASLGLAPFEGGTA